MIAIDPMSQQRDLTGSHKVHRGRASARSEQRRPLRVPPGVADEVQVPGQERPQLCRQGFAVTDHMIEIIRGSLDTAQSSALATKALLRGSAQLSKRCLGWAVAACLATPVGAQAPAGHIHSGHAAQAAPAPNDTRQFVTLPEPLRTQTLSNMRDHLQTLGEIQYLLSVASFDKASTVAESRLGMSSLQLHGSHEVSKYMPKGMQDLGSAMHRSASQLARVATEASVTGDLKRPLEALSTLTQTCVACHSAYRFH